MKIRVIRVIRVLWKVWSWQRFTGIIREPYISKSFQPAVVRVRVRNHMTLKLSRPSRGEHTHEHSDTAPMVTISIGVATHSQETPETSLEELLLAADLALYQAKKKGRNQVQAELPYKEDTINGYTYSRKKEHCSDC